MRAADGFCWQFVTMIDGVDIHFIHVRSRYTNALPLIITHGWPGYGFSGRPTEAGWGLERIARARGVLMKRLGYTRYVAQGGDWGAGVVQAMGRQAPAGLLGIHTNLPAVITAEVGAARGGSEPALAALKPLR